MKKIICFFLAAILSACVGDADYMSDTKDVRIANPSGWIDLSGTCMAGQPVRSVSASLTLSHGFGRTVTVSADEVNGIYVEPRTFELAEGFKPTVVTAELAGTTGPQLGTTLLTLRITGASSVPVEYTVSVPVIPAPAFGFAMRNGKVNVTSDSYKSYYDYSILKVPYDSDSEPFDFLIPYEYGFKRTMTLDTYELWRIEKDGTEQLLDSGSGWSLELVDGQLAEGDEPDVLRFRLKGSSTSRFDIAVRNIRLIVHPVDPSDGDIVLEESEDLSFPQIRVRAYDILWEHNVGPNAPKMTIGYDLVQKESKLTPGIFRMLFDQPLGYTLPVDISGAAATWNPRPFMYQWGRNEDGHQVCFSNKDKEFSGTTTTQSINSMAPDSLFITAAVMPADWHTAWSINDTYWSGTGTGGDHNPCPTGYRIPTTEEVVSSTGHGYFDGLDFHMKGNRSGQNGGFANTGNVFYWACETGSDASKAQGVCFQTANGSAWTATTNPRVNGMMVRCINISE